MKQKKFNIILNSGWIRTKKVYITLRTFPFKWMTMHQEENLILASYLAYTEYLNTHNNI